MPAVPAPPPAPEPPPEGESAAAGADQDAVAAPQPPEERRGLARTLAWTLGAALLSVAMYRASRFRPEPLDGAHTVRPLLLSAFKWFLGRYRQPQTAESHWLILCYAALLIPAALVLWNFCSVRGMFRPERMAVRIARSRVTLFAAVAFGLVFCRFPLLLMEAANPDESMFLAFAHRLFFDPVFFRSADCGSSGPFNVYPLMLPALVGISPDFASARLTGILLITLGLYLMYRALAEVGPDDVARMAILPAFGFFCLVTDPNFVHYSSEHVSIALVSLALFAAMRCVRDPRRHTWPLVWLGALAAVAYFAKQQSVPMIAAAAAVALACVYVSQGGRRAWRPIALLAAGFAPIPILNAWICAATGTWSEFLRSYVLGNIQYAQAQENFLSEIPRFFAYMPSTKEFKYLLLAFLAVCAVSVYSVVRPPPKSEYLRFLEICGVATATIAAFVWFIHAGGIGEGWLPVALFSAAGATLAFLVGMALIGNRDLFAPGLLVGAVLAASVFSIYRAHHMFLHYLLLAVIPASAAMGWMLLQQTSFAPLRLAWSAPEKGSGVGWRRFPFVLLFLALFAACAWSRLGALSETFEASHPETLFSPAGRFIHGLTRPGPTLEVWGWQASVYLEAGRPPALRYAVISRDFVPQPWAEYYRRRFLSEMRQHRPDMIVDARAISCCFMTDPANRFELVPAIDAYVGSNYIQVGDRWNLRFFLRRDLAGVGSARACSPGAIRCYQSTSGEPDLLPPVRMPQHGRIDAEFVSLMPQEDSGLVFGNGTTAGEPRGFQFQRTAAGKYRLSVGAGGRWVASGDMDLPPGQKVDLAIEFQGKRVTIFSNGGKREEMQLPGAMTDAPDPIALGSGLSDRGFLGAIDSFQIRDLDSHPISGGR